jgi:putative addiction module killer protein
MDTLAGDEHLPAVVRVRPLACRPVGESVSEMRIHAGPGYRVYFVRREQIVYLLLAGGDKSSQAKDIDRARRMARDLKGTGQ